VKTYLTAGLILVALLLPGLVGAEATKTCAACGKAITTDQWISADGKYYHTNHFVCAICKQPIGTHKYYRQDNSVYDSTCYVNNVLPKCAYCGKPVGSEWTEFEGKQYHRECYRDHVALRCSLCGEVIEGKYLVDQWGNAYHESHRNEPRCIYCGRLLAPATNGGETYSDGRTICGLCSKDAVKSDVEARKIMNEVRKMLAEDGIIIDRDDLPLKLVDAGRLARTMGQARSNFEYDGCTYFEKQTMLYGLFSNRKFDIYILYGLPRTKYYAAVAHELMHVWLGLNAPMHQNQAMVEGSCNYAASLALTRLGTDESGRLLGNMIQSRDPEYGEGYRQVIAQVKSRGLDGWLEYLKDNTAPPW
jgi:hypothetical protein